MEVHRRQLLRFQPDNSLAERFLRKCVADVTLQMHQLEIAFDDVDQQYEHVTCRLDLLEREPDDDEPSECPVM